MSYLWTFYFADQSLCWHPEPFHIFQRSSWGNLRRRWEDPPWISFCPCLHPHHPLPLHHVFFHLHPLVPKIKLDHGHTYIWSTDLLSSRPNSVIVHLLKSLCLWKEKFEKLERYWYDFFTYIILSDNQYLLWKSNNSYKWICTNLICCLGIAWLGINLIYFANKMFIIIWFLVKL